MPAINAIITVLVIMIFFVLPLMIVGALWRSWWLYPAWGWYIVPLGALPVTFWHFTALLLLVGYITQSYETKKDERQTSWASVSVMFLLSPVIWLILRWLRVS